MTDNDPWTIGGAAALDLYAPEVAAAIQGLLAVRPAGVSPSVNDALRAAAAGVTGLPALGGAVRPADADPAVTAFAEQFAIDVSSMDEAQRGAFMAAVGAETFGAVQMTYVADFLPRLHAALDALFGPSTWVHPEPAPVEDTWPAIDAYIQEIARVQQLDAVATELIRLRGARQHECRLCKSRRNVSAINAGADDATFEAVDHYASSDLPDSIKAALAFTDAIIWTPSAIGADVVAGVRAHFSPAEAVEIALDVARNATNKIPVSLGADDPVVAEGIELFDMDVDGTLTYGMEPSR